MPPPTPPTPEALRLHALACQKGQPGYMDPGSGKFALSSFYLTRQGHCCGQGCRHCPWPADAQRKAGRPDVPAWPWPGASP